jgi:hypothetical protein
MDGPARNLEDLRALVQGLTGKGVRAEVVKESVVFTGEDSPMANLMLSVMGAFAEFERSLLGVSEGRHRLGQAAWCLQKVEEDPSRRNGRPGSSSAPTAMFRK